MLSLFHKISHWWQDFRGKPTWTPAQDYAHLTQYPTATTLKFLSDLDTLSVTLADQEDVTILMQDYHRDDRNAHKLISPFFPNPDHGKTLMIETPYKDASTPRPDYKIDHHWCNYLQTKELEINSTRYGIPSSSSTMAGLLWQKLVENSERKQRRKRIPGFKKSSCVALKGNLSDRLEPECALASILTAQLLDAKKARLTDWPLKGWTGELYQPVMDFVHDCDPVHFQTTKKQVKDALGPLRKPASYYSSGFRRKILSTLEELAREKSLVPDYDAGRLEKKGLIVRGIEMHDHLYTPPQPGYVNAIQANFQHIGRKPNKTLESRNPRCRIKQAAHYNIIDSQDRIFLEDVSLGFKRFNPLINERRIPAWHLPLVIAQPIKREKMYQTIVYAICHPIYYGVPGFSMGKIMTDVAKTLRGPTAGGSELIGSLYITNRDANMANQNPVNDTLSILSQKIQEKVPAGFKQGKIPKDVQKRALRMMTNPGLYDEYQHCLDLGYKK